MHRHQFLKFDNVDSRHLTRKLTEWTSRINCTFEELIYLYLSSASYFFLFSLSTLSLLPDFLKLNHSPIFPVLMFNLSVLWTSWSNVYILNFKSWHLWSNLKVKCINPEYSTLPYIKLAFTLSTCRWNHASYLHFQIIKILSLNLGQFILKCQSNKQLLKSAQCTITMKQRYIDWSLNVSKWFASRCNLFVTISLGISNQTWCSLVLLLFLMNGLLYEFDSPL